MPIVVKENFRQKEPVLVRVVLLELSLQVVKPPAVKNATAPRTRYPSYTAQND